MSNYSILLDTETIGDVRKNIKECYIYEMAWLLFDKERILKKRSYLVKEYVDSGEIKTAYYFDKNKTQIANYKKEDIKPFNEIRNIFLTDLVNANALFAYNISFDINVFSYTNYALNNKKHIALTQEMADYFGTKVFREGLKLKVYDIAHIAILLEFEKGDNSGFTKPDLQNIFNYSEFCRKYGFITDKGNNQTTAESIYNWLEYNKLENKSKFVLEPEQHNAASDIELEYSILKLLKEKYEPIVIAHAMNRSKNEHMEKTGYTFKNLWNKANRK